MFAVTGPGPAECAFVDFSLEAAVCSGKVPQTTALSSRQPAWDLVPYLYLMFYFISFSICSLSVSLTVARADG